MACFAGGSYPPGRPAQAPALDHPKGVCSVLQHMDDSATTVADGTPLAGANAHVNAHANPLPAAVLAVLHPWRLVLDQMLLMAEPFCTPSQREMLRRHRALLHEPPGQPSGRVASFDAAHNRQGRNPPGKGTP